MYHVTGQKHKESVNRLKEEEKTTDRLTDRQADRQIIVNLRILLPHIVCQNMNGLQAKLEWLELILTPGCTTHGTSEADTMKW